VNYHEAALDAIGPAGGTPVCVVVLLVWVILSAPKHPIALIRVVDIAGQPVAGAVLRSDGLRACPFDFGWTVATLC
jgi:hypothetical protein